MSEENPLKMKVLLAEDDSSIRRFIEITLQRAGYEVLAAEDGLAAMQLALANKIDAVVADAMMPNLTGFDLCRILSQNPQFANVPTIILSGFDLDGDADGADFKPDAYLIKSNDIRSTLTDTLSRLIGEKTAA